MECNCNKCGKCNYIGCEKHLYHNIDKNLLTLGFDKVGDDLYIKITKSINCDVDMSVKYNENGYINLSTSIFNTERKDNDTSISIFQRISLDVGNSLPRLRTLIDTTIDSLIRADIDFGYKKEKI